VSKIVFLLAPGVHLLDLAGPAQAFSTAADIGLEYELHYVAESAGAERPHGGLGAGSEDSESARVTSAQGLAVQAGSDWPALSARDLVLVPGWRAAATDRGEKISLASAARLSDHHARGGIVASVCAGAFALGQAGLLDGRRATTHHDLQDELARRHPRARVVRDVLYVTDDRVVTSAGIASGIDLALHLVAIRHGPQHAARIARAMVVYARRNGDEHQVSAMLRYRSHVSDVVHRVQDLIETSFRDELRLAEMATASGVSERTLTRRFVDATGMTPLRYQQLLRMERADHLRGQGETLEVAARAVGFADPRMLRRLRAR
jgi:transcriptional regulator GlxA family with amidase domain